MSDEGIRDRAAELERGPTMSAGRIASLVALVLFIIFVLQNTDEGTVEFLWMDLTLPAWIYLVVIFALGVIVGWFSKMRSIKRKRS